MGKKERFLRYGIAILVFLVAAIVCVMSLPEVKIFQMTKQLKKELREYENPFFEELQPLEIYKNRQEVAYENQVKLNISSPAFKTDILSTDTFTMDQASLSYNGIYDNQEKCMQGIFSLGIANFDVLDGVLFVDDARAYLALPNMLKDVYFVDLKHIGKDYNGSEIAGFVQLDMPKEMSIQPFSNTKAQDWDEIEKYKKELLLHAKNLKSYVSLEKSHKKVTIQRGDKSVTGRALTIRIQPHAINDMLKYIDVVCVKSELYKTQVKHLFLRKQDKEFFEKDILCATYTEDVMINLYLDNKNHLVRVETDSPLLIGEEQDKVYFSVDFTGEKNSLSTIVGTVNTNGERGKQDYSFTLHTSNEDQLFENQFDVLNQNGIVFSYHDSWDSYNKNLNMNVVTRADQFERQVELKGDFEKIESGKGYLFHIANLNMKTDGTEDFRAAGEIYQFPASKSNLDHMDLDVSDAKNLFSLTKLDLFSMVYESLKSSFRGFFQ